MLTLTDIQSHLPEINRFAPKPVGLILILLIAYSLSQLTWLIAVPPPRIDTATTGPAPSASLAGNQRPDLGAEIAKFHLFGRPPALGVDTTAPVEQTVERETTLPLKLLGVYVTDQEEESLAIIDIGKEEKVFAVGESVSAGAILRRVAEDRVILERNGVLEALLLPKDEELEIATPAQRTSPAWQTQTTGLPQGVTANSFRDLRVEILNSPRKLKELARFQKFNRNGRMLGFQVFPKSNLPLFEQLGIQRGDVITSVNGILLDQPEKGIKALRELAKAEQVTLILDRGGNQIVVQQNVE